MVNYKIQKVKDGWVIKVKGLLGWRKVKYKDYGAKENRVKIFKTKAKAEWVAKSLLGRKKQSR